MNINFCFKKEQNNPTKTPSSASKTVFLRLSLFASFVYIFNNEIAFFNLGVFQIGRRRNQIETKGKTTRKT